MDSRSSRDESRTPKVAAKSVLVNSCMNNGLRVLYIKYMHFKKKILTKVAVLLLMAMAVSCTSREQKNDAAFNRVKQEKKQTNDSAVVNDAMTFEIAKPKSVVRKEIIDERTEFKLEIAKRIQLNQSRIVEIKNSRDNKGDLSKKIAELEKQNNSLSILLDEYNKDEKLKWELFKATMNQHVDEIGIELKAITINNKK